MSIMTKGLNERTNTDKGLTKDQKTIH